MKKQPLLWSLIYMVLLLLTFTPLVLVTINLMMIPLVVLFVQLDWKRFLVHNVVVLLAVYAISFVFGVSSLGTVAAILFLFFLIPSVVMGTLYKRKATARSVLTGGFVAMLVQLLVLLLILTVSGYHVINEMRDYMRSSLDTLPAELKSVVPTEMLDQILQVMTQLLPLYLIGFSLYYSIVTHWLSRKALLRAGVAVAGFKRAKDWMLPRSLIWYYLAALVLSYVFTEPDDSMIFMILLNIMPLMMFAFAVQAFGFLFFLADIRGWPKALPRVLTVVGIFVLLFIPMLMQLVSLLGLFDVAFPIRERFKKT
ncbi:DUF2232 domain-containing protein [Paenibacillus sp. HJGM_3]|uniref:DUF2232 domain-containing protein n=1 Tax=Paenibacillus sp. HJGM_3 TaxID=3379816 RepID=UPI00385BE895